MDKIIYYTKYDSDYYLIPTKLDYLSTVGAPTLYEHIEKLRDEISRGIDELYFREFNKMYVKYLGLLPTMMNIITGKPKSLHSQYLQEVNKYAGVKVFKSSIIHNDDEINNSISIPFLLSNIIRRNIP